jgi:choice-of-anchor C domain-containing protein
MHRQIAFAVGLLLVSVTSAHATPFMNGSFEVASVNPGGGFVTIGGNEITGWEIYESNIDYIGGYWTAANGSRSLDLNGDQGAGGIRQTFDTAIGTNYEVRFALAGNPDGAPTTKTVSLISGAFSDTYTFSVAGATHANMNWAYQSFLFTAAATSSTLSFLSETAECCYGPALDDVSVTAVPDAASSMMLFGIGLATLGVYRRRSVPAGVR